MKTFFFAIALTSLLSVAAQANEEKQYRTKMKTFSCKLDDQYILLNSTKVITPEKENIRLGKDGNVRIYFSETECEDSTDLTFTLEQFKILEKGEEAYAQIAHSGPQLRVEGEVSCMGSPTAE